METNQNFQTSEDGKTASIISYITLIGWLISYFALYKDKKTALSTYHLRQSLMLHLSIIAINIILSIIIMIIPSLIFGYIGYIIYLVYVIFAIIGIISANNGQRKPLPLIGEKAQTTFQSI